MKEFFFAIVLLIVAGCGNSDSSLEETQEEEILYISEEFLTDSTVQNSSEQDAPIWGYSGESSDRFFFSEHLARQSFLKLRAAYDEAGLSTDPLVRLLGTFMEVVLEAQSLRVYTFFGDTLDLQGQAIIDYRAKISRHVREGFEKGMFLGAVFTAPFFYSG